MTEQQLQKAVENNFHNMPAFDAGQFVKDKFNSLPKYSLSKLAEHVTDYPCMVLEHTSSYSYYGSSTKMCVLQLLRHTKSRTQAYIKFLGNSSEIKITEKSSGSFSTIPDDMLWLVGLTDHKKIVEYAMSLGIPIDLKVRLEYPTLFAELPEWAKKHEETFTKLVKGDWGYHITKAELEQFIEDKLSYITRLHSEMEAAVVRNPKNKEDYDRYITESKEFMELYRWMLPLVSEGGIFYSGK